MFFQVLEIVIIPMSNTSYHYALMITYQRFHQSTPQCNVQYPIEQIIPELMLLRFVLVLELVLVLLVLKATAVMLHLKLVLQLMTQFRISQATKPSLSHLRTFTLQQLCIWVLNFRYLIPGKE